MKKVWLVCVGIMCTIVRQQCDYLCLQKVSIQLKTYNLYAKYGEHGCKIIAFEHYMDYVKEHKTQSVWKKKMTTLLF